MSLQIKLENTFKTLIETEKKFGENNRFISLSVNNVSGGQSNLDDSGNIYLGDLKYYNVLVNQFKTIDLFIKIEPKEFKQSRRCLDENVKEGQIIYDFKFHNEYVAYKFILPILNKSFNNEKSENENHGSVGVRLRSNKSTDNAYTIEEFRNDVLYREVGRPKMIQHRNSWNPTTYEEKMEEKFYTIKPNSTLALSKCETYKNTNERIDEILKLFPKFYHGEVGDDCFEDNIVVIENMLAAGFCTSNETMFLDKDRILLTLQALGKFHSSSYIAKHNRPKEFKSAVSKLKATGWMLPEYWDIYPNFLNEHLLRGINFLKTDPHYKKYVYKFDSILKNPKSYFFSMLETNDSIAVVCHGDFCKNNILFRYETSLKEFGQRGSKISGEEKEIPLRNTADGYKVEKNKNNSNETKNREEKVSRPEYTNSQEFLKKEWYSNLQPLNTPDFQRNTILDICNSKKSNKKQDNIQFQTQKNDTVDTKILTSKIEYLKKDDSNKEVVSKYHSSTIGEKRKSFLHEILETNAKAEPYTIKFEIPGKSESNSQTEKSSIYKDSLFDKNKEVCINEFNENVRIIQSRNNLKNGKSSSKKETNNSTKPLFLTTNQLITQQSANHYSKISNTTKNLDSEEFVGQRNEILRNRLNYLEENYKELERIYKVNQNVLEKKRVNMKIIEKLNEKKKILEEICRKIEKINAKQEMEFKLQSSMTKLYQNVDSLDLDLKQRFQPLVAESKSKISTNNILSISDRATKAQTVLSQSIEKQGSSVNINHVKTNSTNEKSIINIETQTENRGSSQTSKQKICNKNSQKHKKIESYSNNVDDEFNNLYEESFSEENLIDYEMIFSELTRRVDEEIERNPDTPSTHDSASVEKKCFTNVCLNNLKKPNRKSSIKALFQGIKTYKQNNINILEDSKAKTDDYQTLTVKQRRDNLERSLSLSNGSKGFQRNQKGMKKSNTDLNLVKLNEPLISERNILINDQMRNENFEKETLKRKLLESAENRSRARIFTTSSLSINEDEEFENDDVFESSETIYQAPETEQKSTIKSKYENKDDMRRSKSFVGNRKNNPPPVPMKRTISLIENSISSDTKTDKQTEAFGTKYEPIYKGDTDEDTECIFEETNVTLLGVHYIDLVDIKTNDKIVPTTLELQTQTKTKSSKETTKKSESQYYDRGDTEVTEPIVVKKNISLLGVVDDGDSRHIKPHTKKSPAETKTQNVSNNDTFYPKVSSTLPRMSRRTFPEDLKSFREPLKFKKDTNIVFFDLARMIYSSPVIDLSFFLFLNVSNELRRECWDEFISTYYDSLTRSVPAYVQIPSRTDLLKEVKNKAVYGYFLCCFFLPWSMEENPHKEVEEWVHHGGRAGTEAIANILKFLIDRDFV